MFALNYAYMHNGVFETLVKYGIFNDLGGGAGIGINMEHQTLPCRTL